MTRPASKSALFPPWLCICASLTLVLSGVAYSLGGTINSAQLLMWCGLSGLIVAAGCIVALPTTKPAQIWPAALRASVVLFMAGLNLAAYSAVKHHLNDFGFGADPMLANWDRMLFGTDPINLLGWVNATAPPQYYYYGWFGGVILTIAWTAWQNTERNILLPIYFMCWSLFGPLIHLLMPAAGPVFFDRVDSNAMFVDVSFPAHSMHYSDYLWSGFTSGEQVIGGGISAMPSLHIMTAAWVVLALAKTRIWPLVAIWALHIFLLSISTGWHYAVDGIVSAFVILISWIVGKRLQNKKANASAFI